MEITDNRIKNVTKRNRVFSSKLGFFARNLNMIKAITTALLLLVGLTSVFPLTAMANNAPTFNGAIVKVALVSGVSKAALDVSYHFSDADSDTLSYTAVSSDTSKATVSVSGSIVTFTRVADGTATVTVTASDPGGLTATQLIAVEAYPSATSPVQADEAQMGAFIIPLGGEWIYVDQLDHFADDADIYDISFTTNGIMGASFEDGVIKIKPIKVGATPARVLINKPGGGRSVKPFYVQVTQNNRAPVDNLSDIRLYAGGSATNVDLSSEFVDPDENPLSYTAVSSDTTKATVSLSGSTLTITPVAVGTPTVTVTASDGKLTTTGTISVTIPNRAPTKVGTIAPVTVHLGDGATDVDVSNKFADSDSHTLTYTVASSDTTKVAASLSGGTVKITAVALGTATVTVTANDGNGGTAQHTIAVTVANRPPTTVGTIDAVTLTVGGTAAEVDVSSKFSDPEGHTLTYTAVSDTTSVATVSVSGSTVTITPVSPGSSTVTVTANDSNGGTATQTIAVTVTNRAPTAVGTIAAITVNVGVSKSVDVSSKFSDPDGDTLSYTAVSSDTSKVTATNSSGSAAITIGGVAPGSVTVTVTASDGSLTAQQTIAVTVPNRTPTTVGTISPVTVVVGGGGNSVNVSGNFSDPDNQTLTYTAESSDTSKATVSVSGSTVKITAVAVGSATVTVTASDGSLTATQTIAVTVPNRSPVAVGTIDAVTMKLDGGATDVNVSGNFSDPDGQTLTYTAVSSDTAKATVSVSGAVVKITPVAVGAAAVTVTASDSSLTATQLIVVTVNPANRAPTKVGTISSVSVLPGGNAAEVDVSSNFSDPDNDKLSYTAVSSDTTKVTVSVSEAVVTITPVAAGAATVTVTASDGSLIASQTIDVTVRQSNRAPTAEGTISPVTLTAGASPTDVDVSSKFSDPDNDTLSYTAVSDTTGVATVSVSGAVVSITPKAAGTATVTVTGSDGKLTDDQTINVTVNAAPNRAPTVVRAILPVTLTAGGSATDVNVSGTFSDPDNDTLTYTAVSSATGVATVSVSSSTVRITPKAEGTTTVTVTARDPDGLTATQTINVTVSSAPNRAPTAVGTIPPVTLTAGASAANVNVASNFRDPDDDTLSYTALSFNTGVATVNASGAVVIITPVAAGTATVTVTARDPNGLTAAQTIVVVVSSAPNRAPTAVGTINPVTLTAGGGSTTVNVSGNFNDPDNDTLSYTAGSSDATKATASGAGSIVIITPVAAGNATVTVTASDGRGGTATQTIVVTVNPGTGERGEAPTPANNPSATAPITLTVGGSAQTVNLAAYFSDGGTLTYTAVPIDPSKATVIVSGTIATITPVAEGTTTITVTASNSEGEPATQTIVVVVNSAPNRAPTAAGAILPITLTAGDSPQAVNLSAYFSDPDGDTLSYTAVSASPSVATIAMSNAIITITPLAQGTTTVAVTASDGSLTAAQTLVVLVNPPPNRAPVAEGTIVPVTLTAGYSPTNLDVSTYFSDADGDRLTYTAVSSDSAKATVSMSGSILTMTPLAAGTTTITVMVQDLEGLTITQSIAVTVNPAPNRAPVTSGTIAPITLTAGASPQTVNLPTYFSDPDGDRLSYTAVSANTGVVTVTVSNATVTISPVAAGGTMVMVIVQDADGLTVTQNIAVTVNPAPNRAPVAVGTISPVTLTAGGSTQTVDVSIYFSDPDGDRLGYTAASANIGVATVTVSDATITITPVAEGATTATVTANDGSLTATQTIPILVNRAPNRAPTAEGTIAPLTLIAGASPTNVDISTYFSDPDGDTLSYTAVSANTRVATVTVSNTIVTISPVAAGGTMVMVIVQDTDGLTVTQNIAVTVDPAPNRAPMAAGTILPITLTAGDSTQTVDVSTYFSDPDGDRLGYTAVSANTGVATVTVSNANITITPVAEGATTATVTANDGSLTAMQTIPILVNPVPNRAPVVALTTAPVTLVAGAGPTDLDISVYFSDPDGDKLSYIAVSADTDVATATLSDTTLTITPVTDGATTVTITASDNSLTTMQTIAVLVIQPNRAPMVVETIEPITLTAGDSGLTLDVSSKFLDPAGDVLTYSVQSADTAVATVSVADSTIIITPVAEGATTIIVTAQDSEGLTAFQTVAITVTSTPNRAPVPVGLIDPITLTVGDGSATVNIANKFSDPDGNRLTYNAVSSNTAVATVAVASATLTVTPVNEGTATVLLIVKDTHGLTATRNFTVMVNPAPNRAPVVLRRVDPVTLTAGNSPAAVDIENQFSDPDGDTLTYTAVSADTAVVTASMTDSTLTITPVAAGSTTVILTASDGSLNTTQTIAVTVKPAINRAPVVVGTINPVKLTAGDSSTTMNMADKFSDPDGDALTYTAVSANAAVVTAGMTNSTLRFTPVAAGSTIVMVVVQDTDGLTVTRNITVTVNPKPNRAPVAVGTIDPITLILEGDAQTVDLSPHFSDPDGDALTYTAASSDATKATVSVSNAMLTISPMAEGTTTVMVIVQDTDGLTVTQTIAVTVDPPPNRAPVADGITDPIILMLGEDQTVDLSSLFSDPDGDDLTYSAQSADTTIATVAVANATLTLTPVVEGATTAIITAQDPEGLSITENITVLVNAVPNTLPAFTSATAFSVMENITTVGTVTAIDTDDEDTITGYSITGGADSAEFSIAPLSGELSFNTAPDFENPDDTSGTNQYTVVVGASSGTDERALTAEQTITVTVTDGNDAPLAVGAIDPVTFAVGDADETVDVSGKFSDPDGDALTYSAQSADTTVAQVTVEDSIVTITPVEEGTTTITVTALDAASLTATQPIAVTVVVAKAVGAAGSLTKLDATISAVLSSTGFMNNPGRPVANGDTLTLSVDVGLEGLEVTADISALDSTQSLVSLRPDRNGRYTAEISISEDNTALNGLKHILVIAKDALGNSTQLIITSTLNNRYVTELLPNYPNPFNPETWMPYRLGKDAEVTLTIYDAQGDMVRQFDLGYQPAGAYETRSRAVYWDGTNDFGETVANGVYFYSLSTSDYSRTRKAIILK